MKRCLLTYYSKKTNEILYLLIINTKKCQNLIYWPALIGIMRVKRERNDQNIKTSRKRVPYVVKKANPWDIAHTTIHEVS